eukprot:gene6137-10145_t
MEGILKFSWKDTNSKIQITVYLPSPKIKSKEIKIKQTSNHLQIQVGKQEPIIDDDFFNPVNVEDHWEKQGNKIFLEYDKKFLPETKQQILKFIDHKFCFYTPIKTNELKEFSTEYEKNLQEFTKIKEEFLKDLTMDQKKGDKSLDEAYAALGKLSKDEKEKKENNEKFIEKMKSAAKSGNLNAQNTLISIFSSASTAKFYNLDVNAEEAMYYTKLAALMNEDVVAMTGWGAISETEGEKLPVLIKAASKGFPHAMLEVGTYFYEKEMFSEAFIWFICGMNRGHGASCLEVGGCYLQGLGIEKNENLGNELILEAKKWDSSLESFDEKMLEIEQNSAKKLGTLSPILVEEYQPEDLKLDNEFPSPIEENKPEMDSVFGERKLSSPITENSEKDLETSSDTNSPPMKKAPIEEVIKKKKKNSDSSSNSMWNVMTYGLGITIGIGMSYFIWNKLSNDKKDEN